MSLFPVLYRKHMCVRVCMCVCVGVNHLRRPVSATQVWRCEGNEINRLQTFERVWPCWACESGCVWEIVRRHRLILKISHYITLHMILVLLFVCGCSVFYFILVPSVVHCCSVSHFQHITRRSDVEMSSSFWISTSFFFPALSPVRGRRGERVLSWGGEGREDREEGVTGYYRHPESRTDG